jgi:hypothetical protein
MSIVPPTIYLVSTIAEARHVTYLIHKHTEFVVGEDVVVHELPGSEAVLEQHPGWFIEVDHWLRPQLPARVWEQITTRNHEVINARNDGYSTA